MQSTVKVACLAAVLLALVVRPAAQAQQPTHTQYHAAQHASTPALLAEDDSKTGRGGG